MQFSVAAFLLLVCFQVVQATIYITTPLNGTVCQGGQPCSVQWVDNGVTPLLSNIGPCHVGLYNGHGVLIQQIDPVDVSVIHSLQFTADPKSGPNSGTYYMNFTSVNSVGPNATFYAQYSPFFTLTGMTGDFNSPVSSDTSSISVPPSVASAPSNVISTTFTVPAFSSPTFSGPSVSITPIPGSSSIPSPRPISSSLAGSSASLIPLPSPSGSVSLTSVPTQSSSGTTLTVPATTASTSSSNSGISSTTSTTPSSMITSRIPASLTLPSVSSPTINPTSSSGFAVRSLSSPALFVVAFVSAAYMLV